MHQYSKRFVFNAPPLCTNLIVPRLSEASRPMIFGAGGSTMQVAEVRVANMCPCIPCCESEASSCGQLSVIVRLVTSRELWPVVARQISNSDIFS